MRGEERRDSQLPFGRLAEEMLFFFFFFFFYCTGLDRRRGQAVQVECRGSRLEKIEVLARLALGRELLPVGDGDARRHGEQLLEMASRELWEVL